MAAETSNLVDDKRLQKALSEKMRLLEATYTDATKTWTFLTRGMTSNYKQTMTVDKVFCTCRDHLTRRSFCKHLLFLVARVAAQPMVHGQRIWSPSRYESCHAAWVNRLGHLISAATNAAATSASDQKDEPATSAAATSAATIPVAHAHHFGTDCAICYEPMEANETLAVCERTCKNAFHADCIQQWTTQGSKTCPLCRTPWTKSSARPSARQNARQSARQSARQDEDDEKGYLDEVKVAIDSLAGLSIRE